MAHIHDHSVWTALVRGWVERLAAAGDLRIFHLGAGTRGFEQWARIIHGAELDLLIYPEIGMDATTAKLAALRLAPVQALECGLPIVAREGRFLRGRLASGALQRIGVAELVAASDEAYVELAVALAGDGERRQALRRRIESGRDALFSDPAPLDALERFIESVVA